MAYCSAILYRFLVQLFLPKSMSASGTDRQSPDRVAAAHWLALLPVAPSVEIGTLLNSLFYCS